MDIKKPHLSGAALIGFGVLPENGSLDILGVLVLIGKPNYTPGAA
jgi:hypothetical protein